MKKRTLSILLCFCMVLSLIPMPALAVVDPAISIGGVAVDNNDWYAVTDTNGTVTVTTESAISANCNIHVVLDDVNDTATVTLKDATIANLSNTHAINATGYDLNIVLEGTSNQIGVGTTSENGNAIYSSTGNNVTITGQGDLTLKGSYGININGLGEVIIDTTDNLHIASEWQMVKTAGNITVAAKSIEATGYYFYGYDVSLTARDGDIHSTGNGQYGIQASGDVTLAASKGAISVEGTEYAIKATDYSVNLSAKNDVTLTGTVESKEISISSETGNLTINGYFEAIESAQTSVTLSAPSGDIILNANNSSDIISGINNYTLAITAAGKLEAEGPYGIVSYGDATIKADKVSVENTADGFGFNGGALTITSPSGGNCSEVYISGGSGSGFDAIKAYRDVNIKADKVMIIAGLNAAHAINASSIMGDVTVTIGDTGLIVGEIYIKGSNAISEGILHAVKNGHQASYGLNLNTNTPSQSTYYKAGDGYVIFAPAEGEAKATLLLNNATIHNQTILTDNAIGMENEGIALPTGNIIIKVEGTNSITSSYGDGIGYLGSHVTLVGSGVLTVGGTAGDIMLDDGSFTLADDSNVTLNSVVSVRNENTSQNTNTVYGSRTVSEDARLYVSPSNKWLLAPNAVFTLEEDGNLEFFSDARLDDLIIGDGATIINNNYITLPIGTRGEQIEALPLSGSGLVRVATAYDNHGYPETWDTYTNDGLGLKIVTGNIDLTDSTDHSNASLENDGYEWDAENKTLNLGNAYISGNIVLPAGSVINNTSNSIINGIIDGKDGEACDIRIIGSASLNVNGISGGGTNGDTITIAEGANVTVNGSINIGASGGQDGTLNILGNGTVVNVVNTYGSAVYCDTVNIDDGASLIASTEGSVGVFAHTGVSVKGGSSLVTNCEYGVYVLGGKLEVEHGSKLITNGTVAPFCVVAPQGQPQSETILLPGIPSGTEIACVEGTYTGFGNLRSYWSLISTGGSLGVSNEQNDQVDLSGAFIGPATFQSNLADSTIDVLGTYTYNGTEQIPTIENVIVTLDSGNHTVGSSNYDITASNNVNAGTATLTVTAKDSSNYAGAKSTTFTINEGSGSSGGSSSGGSSQNISYKLTFETNGGSKISEVSKSSGTVIDLSEYKPTRAGFEFNGWYKDVELTDKVSKITLDKNTTIYAKWIEMPTEAKNPFIDVDENSYYHDAVMWAVEEGITSGTSSNTFSPEMITTRAQMVTFLWRTLGMPKAKLANSNFNDMDKDSYYYKAVLWAEENGVTVGTSATTFSPEEKVTRGQVVSFLWRLDGKTASSSVNPFIDVNNDMYYFESILWAVDKGITYGTSEVEYSPDAPCIRAHIVTFLYRQLAD